MRSWIKISAASLAFLPLVSFAFAGVLYQLGILSQPTLASVSHAAALFNFPPMMIVALIKTFNVSESLLGWCVIICVSLWSSLVAWLFWRTAETLLGEDQPARRKFDWTGFPMRFICGFAVGFLAGLRFAINSTDARAILLSVTVTGIAAGLMIGLLRPDDLWKTPA
jgi:hypothetical protein